MQGNLLKRTEQCPYCDKELEVCTVHTDETGEYEYCDYAVWKDFQYVCFSCDRKKVRDYSHLGDMDIAPCQHSLPAEFYDILKVMEMGNAKHGQDSWLDPSNPSLQHKSNHGSLGRHVAEYYCGMTKDLESGLHPLLHVATRSLMAYTRWKRGIQDEQKE